MINESSIIAMKVINNNLVRCLDGDTSLPLFEIHKNSILEEWDIKKLTTAIRQANLKLPQTPEIIADTLITANIRAGKFEEAKSQNLVYFKYRGLFQRECKHFCQTHLDKIYHIKDIIQLYNNEIEPSIIFGGGWGCYHFWEPLSLYKR